MRVRIDFNYGGAFNPSIKTLRLAMAGSSCSGCTARVTNWVLAAGFLSFVVLVYISAKK